MADNAVSSQGVPKAVIDPRFRAGRRLLTEAHQSEAAIQVFSSLLQEAEKAYGAESIETAPVFYEYGNALFRHYVASLVDDKKQQQGADDDTTTTRAAASTVKVEMDTPALQKRREAAAAAAELRFQKPSAESNHDGDKKPAAIPSQPENGDIKGEPETISSNKSNNKNETEEKSGVIHNDLDKGQKEADQDGEADNNEIEGDDDDEEEEDDDDIQLSLEMMETAYSILDEYLEKMGDPTSSNTQSRNYRDWAWEQQSRVLTGIGDVLSTMERHADAADTYLRALALRQERLEQEFGGNNHDKDDKKKMAVEYLRARRLIVESNILIAHEFLACSPDSDVVTTETKAIIVRAAERVDFAREYYNTAQDELQETALLLGQLTGAAAVGGGSGDDDGKKNDLAKEKNNIMHIATLVMGAGMQLAQIDEEKQAAESQRPVKKKAKR